MKISHDIIATGILLSLQKGFFSHKKLNQNGNEMFLRCDSHLLLHSKGALSSLRKFLATESLLKMMKKSFYVTLKALFVLMIFKFLFCFLGHVRRRLVKKAKVNSKIYDVKNWEMKQLKCIYCQISKEVKAIT